MFVVHKCMRWSSQVWRKKSCQISFTGFHFQVIMLVVIVEITVNSSINVILHLSFAYFLIANGVKHSFKEEVSSKNGIPCSRRACRQRRRRCTRRGSCGCRPRPEGTLRWSRSSRFRSPWPEYLRSDLKKMFIEINNSYNFQRSSIKWINN